MKKNMGSADRVIRILLAIVFAALYFNGMVSGMLGYGLLVLAGIFVLTSLVSSCPIYSVLGVSTCPVPDQKQ